MQFNFFLLHTTFCCKQTFNVIHSLLHQPLFIHYKIMSTFKYQSSHPAYVADNQTIPSNMSHQSGTYRNCTFGDNSTFPDNCGFLGNTQFGLNCTFGDNCNFGFGTATFANTPTLGANAFFQSPPVYLDQPPAEPKRMGRPASNERRATVSFSIPLSVLAWLDTKPSRSALVTALLIEAMNADGKDA